MKSLSSFRPAVLVALLAGAAFVMHGVPATAGGALSLKQMSANPIPTPTPIIALATPPLSVASATAAGSCANDEFLSYSATPMPLSTEVTVCGTVVAVPSDALIGPGEGHPAFALDIDGTPLMPVVLSPGQGTFTFAPGDTAVVRGRFNEAANGAQWIDHTSQAISRAWSQPGYVIINGTMHQ